MSDSGEPPRADKSPKAKPRKGLRTTAALPALVTLLNGIAGFASIHYATKGALGEPHLGNLTLSAWLIFAAMLFDALDGAVARMTRQASDFGAQLDSLCDAISFGVAPAILMGSSVIFAIADFHVTQPLAGVLGKGVMAIGALYASCAVLRLARFNIENAPDLLSHLSFKGLPAPGAAATVASMVLLFAYLQGEEVGWRTASWLNITVAIAMPAVTLATALLMISRLRYPHLINQFVRGKRSFGFIVKALLVIVAAIFLRQIAMAAGTLAFAAIGPLRALWLKLRPGEAQGGPAAKQE